MSVTEGVADSGRGRRAELLAAARAELAKTGYERTTVSSIATRAQVAQGTFYLYFPSKEALPAALAEELSKAMGRATAEATADAEGLDEGVEALVAATLATAQDFSDVLLIANRGIELTPDFDQWLALTAEWRGAIEAFLRRLQVRGEVTEELDLRTTTLVLRDILDRAAKAKVLFDDEAYARATSALVRRALSTG